MKLKIYTVSQTKADVSLLKKPCNKTLHWEWPKYRCLCFRASVLVVVVYSQWYQSTKPRRTSPPFFYLDRDAQCQQYSYVTASICICQPIPFGKRKKGSCRSAVKFTYSGIYCRRSELMVGRRGWTDPSRVCHKSIPLSLYYT